MSEERVHVLQMLSDGKISYEQALALLQALGSGAKEHSAVPNEPGAIAQEKLCKEETSEENELTDAKERPRAKVREAAHSAFQEAMDDAFDEVRDAMAEVSDELEGVKAEVGTELRSALQEVATEIKEAMQEVSSEIKESAKTGSGNGLGFFASLFGLEGLNSHHFSDVQEVEIPEGVKALKLEMDTKNGGIQVRSTDGPSVKVMINKKLQAENREAAELISAECLEVTEKQNGECLELGYRHSEDIRGSISFDVLIPNTLRVELYLFSKNGSISVEGIEASGILETKNGGLKITGGAFEQLRAASKNGSVVIDSKVNGLVAETKNGALKVRLQPSSTGEMQLSSVNGSLQVELAELENMNLAVEANTVNGNLYVAVPELQIDIYEKRHFRGQTRGFLEAAEGLSVVASTKNGSLTIK